MGLNEKGEELLFNFWRDADNVKGLWRKTTMESYKTDNPDWTTVLDLDALAEKDNISWYVPQTFVVRPPDRQQSGTCELTFAFPSPLCKKGYGKEAEFCLVLVIRNQKEGSL